MLPRRPMLRQDSLPYVRHIHNSKTNIIVNIIHRIMLMLTCPVLIKDVLYGLGPRTNDVGHMMICLVEVGRIIAAEMNLTTAGPGVPSDNGVTMLGHLTIGLTMIRNGQTAPQRIMPINEAQQT